MLLRVVAGPYLLGGKHMFINPEVSRGEFSKGRPTLRLTTATGLIRAINHHSCLKRDDYMSDNLPPVGILLGMHTKL